MQPKSYCRIYPYYHNKSSSKGNRFKYFSFIADEYRNSYFPIIYPGDLDQFIDLTKIEPNEEVDECTKERLERNLRDTYKRKNTIGEVTLAYGNIHLNEDGLKFIIETINDIVSKSKYWTAIKFEDYSFIILIANEESMSIIDKTIQGANKLQIRPIINPDINDIGTGLPVPISTIPEIINRSLSELISFIIINSIPPEHFLYFDNNE